MNEILEKHIIHLEEMVAQILTMIAEYNQLLLVTTDPTEFNRIKLRIKQLNELTKYWLSQWLDVTNLLQDVEVEQDNELKSLLDINRQKNKKEGQNGN